MFDEVCLRVNEESRQIDVYEILQVGIAEEAEASLSLNLPKGAVGVDDSISYQTLQIIKMRTI